MLKINWRDFFTSSLNRLATGAALAVCLPSLAQADCTLLAEAQSGKILLQQGQCEQALPPNSTFKIPIALMAYDAGLLQDERLPVLDFKAGYADWIESWKQPINPSSWMQYSVVWYSQILTQQLGMARFQDYLQRFEYGNQDASGDAGKDNGITNSWLSSSLRITPIQQLHFIRKLVNQQLPVSAQAQSLTKKITYLSNLNNGWRVHGKTGTGRLADGSSAAQDQIGWFIGWADNGKQQIVFVHQIQDQIPAEQGYAGPRAKTALLARLPELLQQIQLAKPLQ